MGEEIREIIDARQETRWPDYARVAVGRGSLSSLSAPLPIREGLHGGLNLYAAAVRGWRVVRIVVTVEHPEGARECGTGASRDGPNSERRRCAPVPGWVPGGTADPPPPAEGLDVEVTSARTLR